MARKQFNIRLSGTQKTRWEEYVDENPEYDTLTDLIRVAVEREIASEDNPAQLTGATDERVGEVLDTLNELEGKFDKLSGKMSTMNEMLFYFVPNDMEQTAFVYEVIPVGRDNARTADEIGDMCGMYARDVEIVLGQLQKHVDEIKVRLTGDERVFWRTEDSLEKFQDVWGNYE